MADSRCNCTGPGIPRESVCIDTYRVLDSCRDKDCFENIQVYLTDFGREVVERTTAVRVKSACVVHANLSVTPISFNRGFYQISARIYVKLCFEACIGKCSTQQFEGIAVVEKKVILYGSEGNVSVFRSSVGDDFCADRGMTDTDCSNNLPTAVMEVADPVVLDVRVGKRHDGGGCCCCCCSCGELPERVTNTLNAPVSDGDGEKILTVSLGFFSVLRMERPAQFLITGTEYSVPEKECTESGDESPCGIFRSMQFPVCDFAPPSLSALLKEKK